MIFNNCFVYIKCNGSRQTLSLIIWIPDYDMLLIHGVGSVTLAMTPILSSSLIFCFSSYFTGIGIRLGLFCTGLTLGLVSIWYCPGSFPRPVKTSLYSCSIFSFVTGDGLLTFCTWCTHCSSNCNSPRASHTLPDRKYRDVGASLTT